MVSGRCAAHCACSGHGISRRAFLQGSAAGIVGISTLGGCSTTWMAGASDLERIEPCGPASRYIPTVRAAFVRRKEDYGMWWPGAVYDGATAKQEYTALLEQTATNLGIQLDLRSEPIHSTAEADAWLVEAKTADVDGLMVVLLDRQQHAWPTAGKAAKSGIPTIVFSPLGSSFQAAYGMKMLAAGAKMKRARCVVIRGKKRFESAIPDLGIGLQYVPTQTFVDEYEGMGVSDDVLTMAEQYMRMAQARRGATRQDVINGIKSYCVARNIIEREQADAITMDCLGALGHTEISLPCIAWSRMNDDGIPAACEADLGAVASQTLVQYLFDRPGFQQDPVADTVMDAVIGAHCSCPTRLHGFDKKPEPFELIHHHGNRDAVPRTLWQPGQRATCLDVLPGDGKEKPTKLLISVGTVIDNIAVPPAGGCVVSVRIKFDGGQNVLSFPGFHQLFFYGEYSKQLKEFCQLYGLEAQIV